MTRPLLSAVVFWAFIAAVVAWLRTDPPDAQLNVFSTGLVGLAVASFFVKGKRRG